MASRTPAMRNLENGRPVKAKGFARTAYDEITSSENRSVVTSLAFFVAGVAFLHSSWSEVLLPPV